MKTIKLTQGYVTMVDDHDYAFLSEKKWCACRINNKVYVVRGVKTKGKTKLYYMHRDILDPDRDMCVDHINGNPLDNRRINLRVCTNAENCRNRKNVRKGSLSPFKGVETLPDKKFRASIMVNGKNHRSYLTSSSIIAAMIYDTLATIYHGKFASGNFI